MEWGSGPELLLAFHGYSNSADLFAPLAQQLAGTFTTVSVDLPGHGQTRWPAGRQLTATALAQMTRELCNEKKVERTAVTGFSMGGRVAFSLFLEQPQLLSQMVLAAPDGLSPNRLQRIALSASIGERLARDVVRNPARYQKVLDQLHRRGILSATRHQFLQHHLRNRAGVVRIQEGLMTLRTLKPSVSRLRRQIAKTDLPVNLLMGISDGVIPISQGEALVKDLSSATLHRLAKSHRLFDSGTVQQMAHLLRQNL